MNKIVGLFLFFCALNFSWAQRTVTGKVSSDEEPDGVPFATVKIKGTSVFTQTDMDGNFSIEVPNDSAVIVVSSMGFDDQELVIGNQSTLDFSLSSVETLDDVVITALGVSKSEASLGYAQQQIDGDEAIQQGSPNALAGLDGKVAGVQIVNQSGSPGAAAKVSIRGASSASGSDPLIVVDGVPIDNTTRGGGVDGVDQSNRAVDINPEDIESVQVLKGAAATAVWGSRAQNGVIIYTTKKGKAGGISGNASASLGLDFVRDLHKMQTKYGQNPGGFDAWGPELNGNSYTGPGGEVYDGVIHNNAKDFYDVGVNQNYNVSLTGGSEKFNTRASFGYNDYKGVVPNSFYDRYSFRINNHAELAEGLTLDVNANVINSKANRTQRGSNLSGVTLALYRTPGNFNVKEAYENSGRGNVNFHPYYDNPFWSTDNLLYNENVWRVMGSAKIAYDFAKTTKIKMNKLALSYEITNDYFVESTKNYTLQRGSNTFEFWGGYIDEFRRSNLEQNHNAFLTGSKYFGENFSLDFLTGMNFRVTKYDLTGVTATNFIMDDYYNIANSLNRVAYQTTEEIYNPALLADVSLGWKSMLYLNVSARNEWSSALPYDNARNRSGFLYPGVSSSFVFTELGDKNTWGPLSFGKIRAGFGQTGLMPSAYAGRNTFAQISGVWDPSIGYVPSVDPDGNPLFSTSTTLQDPNLRPERTSEWEIGADLRFFMDRLSLNATYYNRITRDGLYFIPTHPSTGYSEMYTNATDIQNQGVEVVIGAHAIKKENFNWNVSLNLTHNKNKVLKINSDIKEFGELGFSNSVQNYLVEGKPFLVMYGSKYVRDANDNIVMREYTAADGSKYLRPLLDGSKKQEIGDPNPKLIMGLRNTFNIGNFTIDAFLHARIGGDVWNGTVGRMTALGTAAQTEDREGTFSMDGVDENGNKVTMVVDKEDYWKEVFYGADEMQIEKDINWLKLRQLSLSYNHKLKGAKSPIKSLTYSVTGTNLLMWTNYSSGDPETALSAGAGAGGNSMGLEYFNNPNVRQVIIGVKMNF